MDAEYKHSWKFWSNVFFMLLNCKGHILFYCFWYNIYFHIVFFNFLNHGLANYETKQGFFLLRLDLDYTLDVQFLDIFQWRDHDPSLLLHLLHISFTNPTFNRTFKIFMIFVSHNKRFIKFCFNYFRTTCTFFCHII